MMLTETKSNETVAYSSAMQQLQHELNEYIKYNKSKTVPEAVAHVARGVVLGRGGQRGGINFGQRREGLYGLTRALAFRSLQEVVRLFASKDWKIKRRYTSPETDLWKGRGQGGQMFRAKNKVNRQKQIRAMIAKDILVPIDTEERKTLRKSKFAQDLNLADPIDGRKGYWQAYQKESGYPKTDHTKTDEASKRFKASRYLSIGWLPAVRGYRNVRTDINVRQLQSIVGRHGYVSFAGEQNNFSVAIGNTTNGFAQADRKHRIVGQALLNVAYDTQEYIIRKKSEQRNRFRLLKIS